MSTIQVEDPRDGLATAIVQMWEQLNSDRTDWLNTGFEARRYVSQTSTDDTEVGTLPWKNKTTIPKLTQIADNLHAYYMAALFPNDEWFRFEGVDQASREKANLIEHYLAAKLRASGFQEIMERVVWDWILYGTCHGGIRWKVKKVKSFVNGQDRIEYRGPTLVRVSPLDVVIDPKAGSFEESPFLRRVLTPIADIVDHNDRFPDNPYDLDAINKVKELRSGKSPNEDNWVQWYKDQGLTIDGFESWNSYLDSQYVEVLEFWGDIYEPATGNVYRNQRMLVADRSFILTRGDNPSLIGRRPYASSSWRPLPDNLYGQGPLANLVGMQYRCDHLENLKADAFDQIVHPMIKIKGDEVEPFVFQPGGKVYVGVDGDVEFLRPDASVLSCNNEVALYHNYMELFAGSPREAMGFRTPGEKTAFEVEQLVAGADRMFQSRLRKLEVQMIQPLLHIAYEMCIRNLDIKDIQDTLGPDMANLGLTEIDESMLKGDGVIRAVGSQYYATRNRRIQELSNFLQIAQNPLIAPHLSGLRSAEMMEEELGFDKWDLVQENIGLQEQLQQKLIIQKFMAMLQGPQMGAQPNETPERPMGEAIPAGGTQGTPGGGGQ